MTFLKGWSELLDSREDERRLLFLLCFLDLECRFFSFFLCFFEWRDEQLASSIVCVALADDKPASVTCFHRHLTAARTTQHWDFFIKLQACRQNLQRKSVNMKKVNQNRMMNLSVQCPSTVHQHQMKPQSLKPRKPKVSFNYNCNLPVWKVEMLNSFFCSISFQFWNLKNSTSATYLMSRCMSAPSCIETLSPMLSLQSMLYYSILFNVILGVLL